MDIRRWGADRAASPSPPTACGSRTAARTPCRAWTPTVRSVRPGSARRRRMSSPHSARLGGSRQPASLSVAVLSRQPTPRVGLPRARRWILLVATSAGAAVLLLSGLAGVASTSDAQSGGTLRLLGTGTDVDSVDPALAYRPNSWSFMYAVCARLYGYPDRPAPQGARIVPEVAKAFPSFSRDGRTATIRLRRTYRFHTGARITAASFVAAINRLANPSMQSPAAFYLTDIVGARAVLEGKARSIAGVRAVGQYTLGIRTTRRAGDLAARLSMPFFCPLPPGTRIDPEGVDDPAGSGPYYIASRVRGRQLVLERNRFYPGPRKPHVGRIVFSVGTGREAAGWPSSRTTRTTARGYLPPPPKSPASTSSGSASTGRAAGSSSPPRPARRPSSSITTGVPSNRRARSRSSRRSTGRSIAPRSFGPETLSPEDAPIRSSHLR